MIFNLRIIHYNISNYKLNALNILFMTNIYLYFIIIIDYWIYIECDFLKFHTFMKIYTNLGAVL